MIPTHRVNRRQVLRGMMGGGAVTVGLPFLDCFLNANGTALASGAPLPSCYVSWFWGLGLTPGRWEPKVVGANYDPGIELEPLTPLKHKINVYSGLKGFLDGKASVPHGSGVQAILQGSVSNGGSNGIFNLQGLPSLDSLIADVIGTKTRFRSLEVICDGSQASYSTRGGTVINPSEPSPAALYTRIFGPEFEDPNAADFKPDPTVMARQSVLSMIKEERESFVSGLGSGDRTRVDEYFTSLRELEQQLALKMEKPAPLAACSIPAKPTEAPIGPVIDDVLTNNALFSRLLAHALACGQTRVANIAFASASPILRKAGSSMTSHMLTHEEPVDPKVGYQPDVAWFNTKNMEGLYTTLASLDSVREGDATLLDRTVVFASTDSGYAKVHGLENISLITAGKANGRMKTGIHVAAKGDPVTRIGLTVQQALGVPIGSWGTDSNQTSNTITEVMA